MKYFNSNYLVHKKVIYIEKPTLSVGFSIRTGERNRTFTGLLPMDFESTASTNSATPANDLNENI